MPGIVAYMTSRSLLALIKMQLETATNVDLKAGGLSNQSLGELAGAAVRLPAGPARIAAATGR